MSSLVLRTTPFCTSPHVVTVVTVTGAIDLATAPQLRSRLDAVPDRGTVVDLAGVTVLAAGLHPEGTLRAPPVPGPVDPPLVPTHGRPYPGGIA